MGPPLHSRIFVSGCKNCSTTVHFKTSITIREIRRTKFFHFIMKHWFTSTYSNWNYPWSLLMTKWTKIRRGGLKAFLGSKPKFLKAGKRRWYSFATIPSYMKEMNCGNLSALASLSRVSLLAAIIYKYLDIVHTSRIRKFLMEALHKLMYFHRK